MVKSYKIQLMYINIIFHMYCIRVFYTYVLFLNGQAIKGITIYTVCDLICCLEHTTLPVPSSNVSYRVSEEDILTYLLTYSLTPWCRILLEKLTGLQPVKKFPAFYGTRRFITALTSVRHLSLSWASPIQSTYPHPPPGDPS